MKLKILLPLAIIQFFCSFPAFAAPATYHDYNQFMSALPGPASVLDFEAIPLTPILPGHTVNGITFNYTGPDWLGTTFHPTALGSSSLGSYDTNGPLGQSVSLSFDPVNAIGMYFVSERPYSSLPYVSTDTYMIPPSFSWVPISNGYYASFIGIIDDQASFTRADILDFMGVYDFYVDDIIRASAPGNVPVPSTIVLLGFGLLGLAGVSRKTP